MAWSFVGAGANVVATATPLTLTEPAGVADGDLLIACISSRTTATTAVSNTGWTVAASQNNNNTLATTSALASGTMLYQVRSGTPDLTFDLPAGISVAMGQIVAYRGNAATSPLDATTAVTTAIATTALNVAGLTTTQPNDLIVAMCAGGQEAGWSNFNNATTPIGVSGATGQTGAPSTTAWSERADNLTTTGVDTSLAIYDAVRTGAGATGNLTATASLGAGHVVIAGAFMIGGRLPAVAGSYALTGTDATLQVKAVNGWNPADKSAAITLSNSDRTATATGSGGVRSTTTRTNGSAGKYYAEYVVGATNPTRLGITPTSNTLTATSLNFYASPASGGITVNSSVAGSFGSATVANDVLCVAWDAGGEKVWFRKNAGNWNNNASHNPATNVGGLDCSFAASTDHALWMGAAASGQEATLRTELAAFTQTVPSGFAAWVAAAGPTAYTLPAAAGSYAVTGTAASLEKSRFITADVGSYALTGADVTLIKGAAVIHYDLPADQGSYALSGTTAGLYRGREVLAVASSYAVSGATVSLEFGREVAADAGSYALTGTAVSLELGKEVLALGGTYAVTGTTATLRHSWKTAADGSSYALTGTAATLTKGAAIVHRTLPADQGAYALTGTAVSLELGKEVLAPGGSYALTGTSTGLEYGREVLAVAGTYALTGTAATFRRTWKTAAIAGSYALTGTPANLLQPNAYAIIGLPGSYAVSGTATDLEWGREAVAAAGSYALVGTSTSLERGREVVADAGSYALTGTAATFRRTWTATAVGGSYALTGAPVNLLTVGARAIIGLPGGYALSGAAASLEIGREVLALAGSYALTGAIASLERGCEVLAGNGSYAVSGATASFIRNRQIAADAGFYGVSGSDATLAHMGAEAAPVYRSIASTTYASRTDSTVCDLPSGAVDGDILIAGIFAGKPGDHISYAAEIEVVPPAGWTQIGTDTEVMDGAFVGTFQVYWKRASGEESSTTFAHTGATTTYSTQAVIAAYSGCIATGNPVEQFSQTAASVGATATATSVTPQYTHSKLVYLGHNWAGTGSLTAPAGTTERFDSLVYLSDEDRPGSGMTGARSQALASSNPWAAFLIDLRSATGILARALGVDQPGLYTLAGASVALEKSTAGILTARPGAYAISGAPAIIGSGLIIGGGSYTVTGSPAVLSETALVAWAITAEAGSYTLTGSPVTLVWSGEVVVTPPGGGGMPWWGHGGHIPKKELRKAIKELLEREEKRKKRKKPREIAREIIAAIEPQGLGVAEKRIVTRLISQALLSELPQMFYSQPLIHDKEQLERAILFIIEAAMQRILDEEEDEEAALLLLSAA